MLSLLNTLDTILGEFVSPRGDVTLPSTVPLQNRTRHSTTEERQMQFDHIHLVINPASGQAEPILHNANQVFYERGIDWDVSVTSKHTTAKNAARQAVEDGVDLVIAYGGDGTVKDVMSGLVNTDVPLGILHGGTGNAMAHKLAVEPTIEKALAMMLDESHLDTIDLGQAQHPGQNDDDAGYFMLRAAVGFQHELLETASRDLKDQFGNAAYLIGGLRALSEAKPIRYCVEIDGEMYEADGLVCLIVNSAAVGAPHAFDFAPEVDFRDGLLDVFILNADFESIMSTMGQMVEAKVPPLPNHWQGRSIKLHMEPKLEVTLDGEPFGKLPLEINVVPQAVKVLRPIPRK
jgi:YegS/Rv2252/BmrU family lipid kinase